MKAKYDPAPRKPLEAPSTLQETPGTEDGPLAYKLPCGLIEPLADASEAWRMDASCIMVGCANCQFSDGIEHVKSDVKRAVAIWAAHERAEIRAGNRQEDTKRIASIAATLIGLSK